MDSLPVGVPAGGKDLWPQWAQLLLAQGRLCGGELWRGALFAVRGYGPLGEKPGRVFWMKGVEEEGGQALFTKVLTKELFVRTKKVNNVNKFKKALIKLVKLSN